MIASPDDKKDNAFGGRRRVGRPSTLENGGSSLIAVLSLIRQGLATTRLEIERQAELGRAVVADRLDLLVRLGLVEQAHLGPAVGGRAPRHMRFRAEAAGVLVAQVDRGSLAVGLADLNGELIVEHHEALNFSAGPEAILERLTILFIWLLDERGGKNRAWGIGLALPEGALTEAHDAELFRASALDTLQAWRNFDFATELSLRFGAPCLVSGVTQMQTLGEMRAGAARGVADVLCVRLDRSVSAGVASGGRLHRGAQGSAGLIGHAPTGEGDDLICHCGARGCLDMVASGEALAGQALAAVRGGRSRFLAEVVERQGDATANEVIQGAQLGDAMCAEMLARSGRLVGEALAPLVNLLNPAVVVLAGALANSGEILLAAVREGVYRCSHPLATRDLQIVRSQLGGSAELIGAAAHVLDALFDPPRAREWILFGAPRMQPSFIEFLARVRDERRRRAPVSPPAPAPAAKATS
jgi:predicted NBD/HSP70 family sugar kinase